MTTTTVLSVRTPAMPRGARVAAQLFVRALGWMTKPVVEQVPTRFQEAAAVRELAYRVQSTDPGFAADLFAAADRHEGN